MISPEVLPIDKTHPNSAYLTWGAGESGYFFQYGPFPDDVTCGRKVRIGANNVRRCREEFYLYRHDDNHRVGFSLPKLDIPRLNKVWSWIERRVGAGVETVWHPVDMSKDVVVADMSPFWFKDTTAFHMMTLLLRLVCVYYNGDFNKAVKEYELAKSIRKAIRLYLKGHTQPAYTDAMMQNGSQSNGVVNFFYGKDGFELRKLLVKPTHDKAKD